MCVSVNITAVRAPAVLNCCGTNWRPPSYPTPRKTGALFQVWPHQKTWFTPWLVQLDLFCHLVSWSSHGCGQTHSLSPTLAQGRWWQNGPCHYCSHTHLLPRCSLWFFDYCVGCCGGLTLLYIKHPCTKATLSLPSTSTQGGENTTKYSWVRDRQNSLTSYCHGWNRL